MCQKRDDLSKKILQCRSELSKICPAILVQSDHKSYVLLQNFRLGTSLEDRILRGLTDMYTQLCRLDLKDNVTWISR